MQDVSFTAGITLTSGEVLTVDVETIDGDGIHYQGGDGPAFAGWDEIKAVMLATTDHMLESAGYMLDMSDMLREQQRTQPYDADRMRAQALGLLAQVAPRLCPDGPSCPLARTETDP